jgi:hypothetical protein
MAKINLSIDDLNKMKPAQVIENENVRERFISLYNKIHDREDGEVFYEKEKYNLVRIISANNRLANCTGFSTYGVFLDIASMGISTEQSSSPMLYILSRGKKKQDGSWDNLMYVDVSPYGELSLRIQAGQIKYADRPIVVYEGDIFEIYVEKGQKLVDYRASIPRKSNKIIGCFVGLTRPDGSKDFHWMLPEDIARLQGYSHRQNNRGNSGGDDKSNDLYHSNNGQIDTGFFESKTLKHAFKAFPKIKLGQFSKLQQSDEQAQAIDYGLDETVQRQTPPPEPFDAQPNEPGYHEPENEEEKEVAFDIPEDEGGF